MLDTYTFGDLRAAIAERDMASIGGKLPNPMEEEACAAYMRDALTRDRGRWWWGYANFPDPEDDEREQYVMIVCGVRVGIVSSEQEQIDAFGDFKLEVIRALWPRIRGRLEHSPCYSALASVVEGDAPAGAVLRDLCGKAGDGRDSVAWLVNWQAPWRIDSAFESCPSAILRYTLASCGRFASHWRGMLGVDHNVVKFGIGNAWLRYQTAYFVDRIDDEQREYIRSIISKNITNSLATRVVYA